MGYTVSQTSLAHTYGNITCQIVDYLKNMFPENYFKTIHVSSTIAYRQFNIFQNSSKEFLKKTKPMLIIRPRVELNDSEVFLYNTYLTTRMTDNYMDTSFTNLQPFIYDKERGNCMKFLLNRLKMMFDVTIVTETQIEQLNIAHFFKNRVRQDRPFFIKTSLESYIPRELMRLMSEDVDIPLYDENGSVAKFLEYVNGVSAYPITYKIKNSSGNDEFFRHYPVNVDTSIQGLSIDDGSKRGFVSDMFTTTFTVSTEFNATGLYYYFASKPNLIDDFTMNMKEEESNKIIPLFTINNLDVRRPADGWNVYCAPVYMISEVPDITDIRPLINNSVYAAIQYHKEKSIPLDIFIKYEVLKDNVKLEDKKDYILNFDDFKLTTFKCSPNSTYRFIMYINTLYINELINDILNLSEEK